MKFIATTTLLALFGYAAAFSPTSNFNNKASVSLKAAAIDELVGALKPVGFWDPLGFAAKADDNTLRRYREAELTHGRVASKYKRILFRTGHDRTRHGMTRYQQEQKKAILLWQRYGKKKSN